MSQRPIPRGEIVAATHNPGKLKELAAHMEPLGFTVTSAGDAGLPEPEETETTFEGNADLKSVAAALGTGKIALSDDSGLAVEALDGAPGIYSARWAGPDKDFSVAMQKVEEALQAKSGPDGQIDRRAKFVCVLSLAWPDGETETFRGEVKGRLVWPPRGDRGFGYDPMFVADGQDITFGEMEPAKKHAMSHRAVAFAKLKARLESR